MINAKVHKALAWSQPMMIVLWVGAFVFLAGFIPPPDPSASAQAVVAMYEDDQFAIQLGLVVTLFASALLVPFAAVVAAQMRRIEGPGAPLAMTQLCSAALLSLEFIIPIMVWQTAAFRLDDDSARLILMLNDMGWLMFVAVISSAVVQMAAIGIAILTDTRSTPVFPRWAGYFNLWVALLLAPAGLVVFFKEGALAWNGLIGFFCPLVAYCTWSITMFVLVRRAIDQEAGDLSAQTTWAGEISSGGFPSSAVSGRGST